MTKNSESQIKMPTLFLGHGSPMNAISKNAFTDFLSTEGKTLPRPKAILTVSAHWETRGTKVLKRSEPETIHDFGGFPSELFAVQYPAKGSEQLADQIAFLLKAHEAEADSRWGLDHGTWSLLKHMYPEADIPVLQLSLNQNLSLKGHLEIARDLRPLREQGVLILGSGNITHNLRNVDWGKSPKPMAWAQEFDEMIKAAIVNRDYKTLLAEDSKLHSLWKQALPSLEHYLPLLYVIGSSDEKELAVFPYEEMQMGSISMRAVKYSA